MKEIYERQIANMQAEWAKEQKELSEEC